MHGRHSFLTIELDARDPLARALSGMAAPATDVSVLVHGSAARAIDDRPLHLEIATV